MQDQSIFSLQQLLQKPKIDSSIQHQAKIHIVIKILDTNKGQRKPADWYFLIKEAEEIPFFQNIIQTNGYSKLLFLLQIGEIRRYKRKDIVIKAGQYFKGMYILLDGLISKQMTGSAMQLEKNNLKKGAVFGDTEIYQNSQSEYTVNVLTNSVFYFIGYQAFTKHIQNSLIQTSPVKQNQMKASSFLGMARSFYRNKTPSLERLLTVKSYLKTYLIEHFQIASLIGKCDFENLLNIGSIEKLKPRSFAYKEGQKIEYLYFILTGEFECMEMSDYTLGKSILVDSEPEYETISNPAEQKYQSLSVNKFDKNQDKPLAKRMKPICLVGKGNILGFPDAINSEVHINSAQCKGTIDGILWKVPQESFFKCVNYYLNSNAFSYMLDNISLKNSENYSKQLENLKRAKPAQYSNTMFKMHEKLFKNLTLQKNQSIAQTLEERKTGFVQQIKKFQLFKKQIDNYPLLSRYRVESLLIRRIPIKDNENLEKYRRRVQTSLSIEQLNTSTVSTHVPASKHDSLHKNYIDLNVLRKNRVLSLISKQEQINQYPLKTISLTRIHECQKQEHYNTLNTSILKNRQDQQKALDTLNQSMIYYQSD